VSLEPLGRPPEPRGELPAFEFHEWINPVYRIQDGDRISSRRYPTPRYRFDAPGGEYAVLYAKDTEVATFNESYAEKRRRIPSADAERHLVRNTPKRPLPLVDLKDDRTLSTLDLDARISVGDDYEVCRQWALAFHAEWPEVCGIAYAARWGGVRTTNVALFVERCGENLTLDSLGRLGDPVLEESVLEAADRYRLRVAFLV
jgi:hypothetical protein